MASRTVTLENEKAARLYEDWIAGLMAELDDPARDRNDTVARTLAGLYLGAGADPAERMHDPKLSLAARVLAASFDPRHTTLEAEYYAEIDAAKFARAKPLLWLWYSFDRSPAGGQNVWLGIKLRRALAQRLFKKCAPDAKFFQFVEFSFGYNISFGEHSVVHRHVLLDDRGEIIIGNGVSISDYANVYSHGHDTLEIEKVSCGHTVIGDGARVTYHSTVLSGITIGADSMLGSHGLATRNIPDHAIHGGVPARPIAVKKR